ncbi:IS110 family transposase [Bacteroidota bacterium]
MIFKEFIGIDLAKESFDVWIYSNEKHKKFSNDQEGFENMIQWITKKKENLQSYLLCMEHTGMYGYPLMFFLFDAKISFTMISGLHLKRSLGIQRGKNDKVDASRIAEYAYLHRDKIKPFFLASLKLIRLKALLSCRVRLVKYRAAEKSIVNQNKRFLPGLKHDDILIKTSNKVIKECSNHIDRIEEEMMKLIDSEEILADQYKLVKSVKGVGMVATLMIICHTNGFASFPNWRKFASYSGTAPFEHSSGTSIRGRTKTSHLANKAMKAILTSAAIVAIRHDPEIKKYYQCKIKDGKNKMLVINNVRNKLISRIFAVVKRGSPYVSLANWT